jgi:DNA polymerase IIIc chi subunit
MIQPDFSTWSHANLVKFASETYARVIDDVYEMEELRKDLKAAIQAYREVNTRTEK